MIPISPLTSRRRSTSVTLLACALAFYAIPAFAQAAPERQSDRAVKALLEQIDVARDKFEGNLDGSLKDSTIRNATGEIKVSAVLQDLQDNTKKLKERFTEDYSASAEVTTVLKQYTAVDGFMQRSTSVTKGRSEWDFLASHLKSLAAIYGTTFPLPDTAVVRRMNDKETAAAADELANAANQYKDGIDEDKTLPKADKDAAKKSADDLNKAAKALKSRLSDSKPATAEMKSAVQAATTLGAFAATHPVALAAAGATAVKTSLAKIEQSFGLPAR